MSDVFKPVESESLKDVVIRQLEELILSGKLAVGEKLPSERELATMLKVGRPLVHEAIVELSARDLVSQKPRVGTVVNDFRKHGSLSILNTLIKYRNLLSPEILEGVLEARMLIEVEMASLAAKSRSEDQLSELRSIIERESLCNFSDTEAVTELDFEFHLAIAIASNNMIYPLMINSFKVVYTNFSRRFFAESHLAAKVFKQHKAIFEALSESKSSKAANLMKSLLQEGALSLKNYLKENQI